MATDSNSVANQAIFLIGDNQPKVSGQNPTWDQSTAGLALQSIYGPTVAAVMREFGWDAARRQFQLVPTANVAPFPYGFAFEYAYPPFAVEIWEVQAQVPVDLNDPLPVQKAVGNTQISGVQTKVIWTNQAAAYATLNNNPTESTWDPLLIEAIVRELASKLAVAIAGKPDTSALMGQTAQQAAEINKTRAA